MTQKHIMNNKIPIRNLNSEITCRLCEGYLIDATTLVDCLHYFCRACILRYFENNKTGCPSCNTVYKKKTQACFRPDPQIQSLVYKLIPSLYAKETQRREDFYRSTGLRASSSCSDDSVIDRERDMINDQEEMISEYVGDKSLFLSPDDSISLSLEYYQSHLDLSAEEKTKTSQLDTTDIQSNCEIKTTDNNENSLETTDETRTNIIEGDNNDLKIENNSETVPTDETVKIEANNVENSTVTPEKQSNKDRDQRFLRCPAAVPMKLLQKFIRMKFGLTADHKVDIIYKGEVLPNEFSLIDVAYTFKWTREKPLRFFYRIFTPMKIKPIKIVNTTLSTGGKQLQIVPLTTDSETSKPLDGEEEKTEGHEKGECSFEETEEQKNDKERLFAHLQLQSKPQVEKEIKNVPEKPQAKVCVFEYEEPDEDEIKKFAEKRDREWALQKKLDESKRKDEYNTHHSTKKRKKNKHSKNEFSTHKKRKLHAEIASNEEDLKLKVKITNNGHKHKHHKSQFSDKSYLSEASSKEKLLQMRQVRHKHVPSEDKIVQTVSSSKLSSTITEDILHTDISSINSVSEKEQKFKENGEESKKLIHKIPADVKKLKIKVPEPSTKVSESAVLPKQQNESTSSSPKAGTFLDPSSSKSSFSIENSVQQEWGKKIPTVQLERNELTEKQAKQTFLKTFHAYAEKYHKNEKIQQTKIENAKMKLSTTNVQEKRPQIKTENNKINTNNKNLDRKIANLQQRCTIEAKQPEKIEPKICIFNEKSKIITPHYPPGFTVSKIEQGVKRKAEENESIQDKRPSLEITLINPPIPPPAQLTCKLEKSTIKRPPPATIPLDRIKKSVNLKSGISIIPKLPERCDNIGALDLSKSGKSSESSPSNSPRLESSNGVTITPNRQVNTMNRPNKSPTGEKNNIALSNLQMLSKVATEHSTLNNKITQLNNVPLNKPLPNLQTLKQNPSLQNPGQIKSPNLQKIPKLNEIQKFRPSSSQIRHIRPNQNQNIRNIPNPSLLIRQQNQNRLNSQISIQQTHVESKTSKPVANVLNKTSSSVPKETTATCTAIPTDCRLQEKSKISV